MDFNDDTVAEAIAYVVDRAATEDTVTYTDVFIAVGLPAPQEVTASGSNDVTRFMKAFHDLCQRLGYPGFDALVVNAAGERHGWPGAGYFTVNGWDDPLRAASPDRAASATRQWEDERAACYAFARGR